MAHSYNGETHHRGRGRGRNRHHGGHQHQAEMVPFNVAIRRRLFDLCDDENISATSSLETKRNYIRDNLKDNYDSIIEGLQIGITQQPYKMPFWATLLTLVIGPEGLETDVPWPNRICSDLVRGFQAQLDKLRWREIRLYLQFFGHLAAIGFITPESMVSQLLSFTSVLDEPGVSYERASMAALCAGEALLRAASVLHNHSPHKVYDILSVLGAFSQSLQAQTSMSQPVILLHTQEAHNTNEQLKCLLSALREVEDDGFAYPATLLRPQENFPQLQDLEPTFALPSILVPPEIAHVEEEISTSAPAVHHRELPTVWIRLFDVEPSINPTRAGGYLLRSTYEDVIDIYEVNRKEAAKILLQMDRWFTRGTFRSSPGATTSEEGSTGVQLELSVMETILGSMMILPRPKHKPVYYHALITEFAKLSASTVGPAVGKSIRKLYALLGEGLDVEAAKRFSDWFAVHMSNFGYQWVWKEWTTDLQLDPTHPKRTFMRRAIELEIRLSYYDRILKTLPDAMQSPEAQIMPAEIPGHDFEYESSGNSHHYIASNLLKKLQDRATLMEVSIQVDTMRTELTSSGLSDSRAGSRTRSITMQCLLVLGARSFSHFLNAIERYIKVLQNLSTTPDAKFEMLEIVSTFWRRNRQMITIIFDKLMQYQIVDPSDVVSWAFEGGGLGEKGDGLGTFQWEVMRLALDKSNGRVSIAQRRIVQQRKIDDEARAAKIAEAAKNESMDVDDIAMKAEEEPIEESTDLQKQTRAHQILVAEQKSVLSRAVEGFVTVINDTDEVISETAWNERSSWTKKQWDAVETWGWFRHFARSYAPYLRVYRESLSMAYLSRVPAERPAGKLLREIWSITVEQDS